MPVALCGCRSRQCLPQDLYTCQTFNCLHVAGVLLSALYIPIPMPNTSRAQSQFINIFGHFSINSTVLSTPTKLQMGLQSSVCFTFAAHRVTLHVLQKTIKKARLWLLFSSKSTNSAFIPCGFPQVFFIRAPQVLRNTQPLVTSVVNPFHLPCSPCLHSKRFIGDQEKHTFTPAISCRHKGHLRANLHLSHPVWVFFFHPFGAVVCLTAALLGN